MIRLDDVSKRYGRREALTQVSLAFEPGTITLLVGANGAGKSTLLRCLLGLERYDGRIQVAGRDPIAHGRAVRASIGYMPQTGGLHPDLTAAQTLRYYADIRRVPRSRCDALLADAGLTAHADASVAELSGGLRQRLGFAVALLADPAILVLDEPSGSLDAASRAWLARRLRERADAGALVVVSAHAGQELVDVSDRRVTLEDGRVVSSEWGRPHGPDGPRPVESVTGAARPAAAIGSVWPVMRKELRDAIRSRWVAGYALLVALLGLAATATAVDSASGLALQSFGRTTATLMNLCLLLAPIVAVLTGAGTIAGERERGTLEHLLAQPISRTGLLLAKHAGLLLAISMATLAGFLPAGVLVAQAAGPAVVPHYLIFPAIAILAGAAMAAVGLVISVSSRSAAQAQGTAVFAWFAFVLLYDLVLMGSLAASGLSPAWLAAALVANPIDAARVLGVLALEPDLYLLGPAGAYLTTRLSSAGAAAVLLAALAAWTTVPVATAVVRFSFPLWRQQRHAAFQSRSVPGGERPCRHSGVQL